MGIKEAIAKFKKSNKTMTLEEMIKAQHMQQQRNDCIELLNKCAVRDLAEMYDGRFDYLVIENGRIVDVRES